MNKLVKAWGKWFLANPESEDEKHAFYSTRTGIVDDVIGEQDALDFSAKLKSVI